MSKRQPKPALLVRVLTEIGKGRITEGWIPTEHDETFHTVSGKTCAGHITVNPAADVVDTLIHEALHRINMGWSEAYVRNRTTFLIKRMSAEQIQQLFEDYNAIVKRRKKRARKDVRAVLSGSPPSAEREGAAEAVQRDGAGQRKPAV